MSWSIHVHNDPLPVPTNSGSALRIAFRSSQFRVTQGTDHYYVIKDSHVRVHRLGIIAVTAIPVVSGIVCVPHQLTKILVLGEFTEQQMSTAPVDRQ
jgi:hypothetical protein